MTAQSKSQVNQDLRALRAVFSDASKWTQDAYARDAKGRNVAAERANNAKSWCLHAAILRVTKYNMSRVYDCIVALLRLPVRTSLIAWNDAEGRTFQDVISLIDKAIEETK